jgi:capsular polysaccharide transport system permease protein
MKQLKTQQPSLQKADLEKVRQRLLHASTVTPHYYTKKTIPIWKRSWLWLVVVRFLMASLYFGLIASDRYVSQAKVIVKQADNSVGNEFNLPLLGVGASSGMLDAKLVREFILSLDMLQYLDATISLRKHYENENADVLSRLWENDTQEGFLNYYRSHVTVVYDEQSAVLKISAQGFAPEFSQKIVETLLKHSEDYINEISHRLAKEQVGFVETELARAAEHLRQSKKEILKFQEQYELFSPTEEGGAKLQVVNELEAQLTQMEADLNNLQSYMNDTAPEILALKAKIGAVMNQLMVEREKLVGKGNLNFGDVTAKYADLQLDLEFATDLYKTSLLSLEQARIEAYRKLKHLVVVDSPSLAEEPELPRRLYNLASILIILLLLYGVFKIALATIREHQDV